MKVSELADELEVPASAVLAQCQRFGIDASWAGAELRGADLVVLRAELAGGSMLDLTDDEPAPDPVIEPTPAAAAEPAPAAVPEPVAVPATPPPAPEATSGAGRGALPPTAVGSLPDLVDEVTPAPEEEPPAAAHVGPIALGQGGVAGTATKPAAGGEGKVPGERSSGGPRLQHSIRSAIIATGVGAAAFAVSNVVDLAIFVALLWLVAAICFVIAVIDAFRGYRHASMHPQRYRGTWTAIVVLVLSLGGVVAVTASVLAVTADDVSDAPPVVQDLSSVQLARWGYQRTMRLSDNGWQQPAREDGSCWRSQPKRDDRSEQRVERVELNDSESCNARHSLEVVDVFAYNRDADAPYPGVDQLLVAGQKTCAAALESAQGEEPDAALLVEYPTQSGWGDGDHDIVCAITTPVPRKGSLDS